ncbi:NADP-dependent oxidoreductase [Metabacillus sp. GX 13764]|uniref:NADP-dependent oxidoreductase n=1 Tax=Metabacillus kandeliae TaxID=2900151 RepID=UPI001E4FD246|nr:NADP-dependent oxidoreductase [Metabacillus kandeliae]MCD7033541.1 NADP-dependent oxidoreductase [Metabacillus kandeliae]
MKAIVIEQYGGKENLKEIEMEKPEPGEGQVLVKLLATSINPIDWKLREGYLKDMMPFEFPIILGWDAAGIIEKTGKNVNSFKEGDAIFARPETTNRGTYAEYTIIDEHLLAKKPESISFEDAASVPLAGMTAWQCLFDFGNVQEGDKVLIHAGSGGVGSYAIQFAKHKGAYVITTASGKNTDYVKSLGADKVINYKEQDFEKEVSDLDFVLDAMGGEVQKKSFSVLKKGGRLASIVEKPDEQLAEEFGVTTDMIWLQPKGDLLAEIGQLMEDNKIKPVTGETFPLTEQGLKDAHELSESHHARGKIVISASK